jgi:hypothetical protein
MTKTATYESTCPLCEGPIAVGAEIEYHHRRKEWHHYSCPGDIEQPQKDKSNYSEFSKQLRASFIDESGGQLTHTEAALPPPDPRWWQRVYRFITAPLAQ